MNMAIVKRGLAVAVLFAGLSPIACGSDSGGTDTTMKPTRNNDVDSGPSPMPTSTAPAGSVPCGDKNCTVPEGSMGPACCMDHFAGTCGVVGGIGMGCVKPPPPPPKDCPTLPSIGGVFMLRSCCTTGSLCGVDTSMFPGGGCTDYATFKAMAAMYMGGGMGMGGMGGMFTITLPDPDPACTPAPAQ
jgi:hypothetical protein